MFDLITSFPLLHTLVGLLTGVLLTFSVERLWDLFQKDPLVNTTTALVKRFSSTTLTLLVPIGEKIVALYKGMQGALQPVKETIRFAFFLIYNATVLFVNLTITTVQKATAQGLSITNAVSSWVTKSPALTPYDIFRVTLPFLLLLVAFSVAYSIRAAFHHEVKKPRHSSRRAMQLLHDLDAPTFASR
jgi:hypothetical protein